MITMRRAARVAALVCAAVLGVAVAGCGSSSSSSGGGGSGGGGGSSSASGELRVGTLDQFQNPNPFNVFHVIDYDILMLEYPYLVQYNESGQVVPDLATSWTHSANGSTWTFHLRSGAKWSDGQPMTSQDVAWTMNTIIKYQKSTTALWSENVSDMTSATTPDPTTVVLHYSAPVAAVLSFMNNTPILPMHVWDKHTGGKDGADLKSFKNSFPDVAGGPYIPEKWDGSTFLLMKANPNYYGPKPHIENVGIEYFTTPDGLIQALKTKAIDYANQIPQSNASTVKSDGVVVNPYPAVNYLGFYINAAPKAPHQELLNPLVRQAIDVGVDRQAIINVAYPGSQAGESIVPPAVPGWSDPSVTPTYDPAKANQLLDQAGFKKGANGIRVADGHPMQYTVIVDHVQLGGAGDRVFQILQTNLKALGIGLTERPLDPNAWLAADYGTNNTYNQFDMGLETNAALLDPGFNLIYFTCADYGAYNWSGFCNKQYDSLYAKQSATLDPAKRKPIVFQMQKMAQQQVPAVILLYTNSTDAHQPGWTGFGANPNGSLNYFSKLTFTSIRKG